MESLRTTIAAISEQTVLKELIPIIHSHAFKLHLNRKDMCMLSPSLAAGLQASFCGLETGKSKSEAIQILNRIQHMPSTKTMTTTLGAKRWSSRRLELTSQFARCLMMQTDSSSGEFSSFQRQMTAQAFSFGRRGPSRELALERRKKSFPKFTRFNLMTVRCLLLSPRCRVTNRCQRLSHTLLIRKCWLLR